MALAAARLRRLLRSVRDGRTALWYFMAGTSQLGASSGPLRSLAPQASPSRSSVSSGTRCSVLSTHSARYPKTRRRSRGANDGTLTVRLDRKRIVEGALALVDDVGLSGLNMRRLAERLGTKPMSLYRHVPSKAELLDAIAEQVVS